MRSASSLTLVAALVLAAGCDAGAREPKPAAAATVTLTSVAFADDCGGTPPSRAPIAPAPAKSAAMPARPAPAAERIADEDMPTPVQRRCEQTSMQLSITATRATEVRVKSVEVFDERGKSLGVLASRAPTRWSDAEAMYQPWDEKVDAGQTALVSYVLAQPSFVSHYDERDRTYTVKVLASVGGVDQPLRTTVMIVGRPAPVPT